MKVGTKIFAALLAGCALVLGGCTQKQATPSGDTTQKTTYGVAISNKTALQEEWPANGGGRKVEIETTPKANVKEALLNGDITITSDNEQVLTISGQMAMPVAAGNAKITVASGDNKDTVDVVITEALTIKSKYGVAHEGTAEDPLTPEEAIAVTKHADYNTDGGHEDLYVSGVVASFYHAPGSRPTDGAVSWFYKPAEGTTEKFEIYKCYKDGTGAASYLTDDDVWINGTAVAHGRFTTYNGQCETDGAKFVSCEGNKPQPRQTIEATFAEALAAGKALEDGAGSWDYYQFTGFATKNSGSNYYLTATKGEAITDEKANTIEIYGASDAVAAKLLKNAKVTVKMELKNYHGQVENNLPLTADDVTVVENGTAWVVPEHNVTVAQAIAAVAELGENAYSDDLYVLTDVYVTEVTEAYSSYGNMSFKVADTADGTDVLTVFRAKTDATTAAKVVAGAQVTVKGNLQKNVYNGVTAPYLRNVASISVKESGEGGGGEEQGNYTLEASYDLSGYFGASYTQNDGKTAGLTEENALAIFNGGETSVVVTGTNCVTAVTGSKYYQAVSSQGPGTGLKLGTGSAEGYVTLTTSKGISKVVITVKAWSATKLATVKINDAGATTLVADDFTTARSISLALDSATTTVKISCSIYANVQSIALYSAAAE